MAVNYTIEYPSHLETACTGWLCTVSARVRGAVWSVRCVDRTPLIITRDGAVSLDTPGYLGPLLRMAGTVAGGMTLMPRAVKRAEVSYSQGDAL